MERAIDAVLPQGPENTNCTVEMDMRLFDYEKFEDLTKARSARSWRGCAGSAYPL